VTLYVYSIDFTSRPLTVFQWVIIDSRVYDLSRFANLHPGGLNVLLDEEVAGQDATKVFYGLHRQEVLQKPQYLRLQIGTIEGEGAAITPLAPGELSKVPYAEPTWLSEGYYSPFYNDVRLRPQSTYKGLNLRQ
jgi:hypothetical protein